MYGGIRVHSLQTLSVMPSIGSMLGTGHSQAVLERLQAQSGGQVIFGQEGDPVAERYRNMLSLINTKFKEADDAMTRVYDTVFNPNSYTPVQCLDDLYTVSPSMQTAIVTYEPVRRLLCEGKIYGYGINPENLPEEDVYGRLIDNGCATPESKELTWKWETTDPKLTDEELHNIKETRAWIDDFLAEQLKVGGQRIDPTDPENTIRL